MSDAKLVNFARLVTTYSFVIEELPDDLRCAQCRLVLKVACQVPCGCRFCQACINDLMSRRTEFCPGDSEDCGESLLSRFTTDYLANKRISRLTVKCPHDGCVHKCQLANMEEHLRECQPKSEECAFRELGCTQDKLAAEQMDGHLQQDTRRHSEILIEMVANINREIETLKHELVLKDHQNRSLMDQMIHVQNENKSIKNDIKAIKEENADLAGQVRILSKQIEREIAERRENDELDSASNVIEPVDREIPAITGLMGLNKDKLVVDIQSINQNIQSITNNICAMKSQGQAMQTLAGLGQIDASYEWQIDTDVGKSSWNWEQSVTDYFSGSVHPYKYRLKSWNYDSTAGATLYTYLCIYAGPNDGRLVWPFKARVVSTVADRDRRDMYRSITTQCQIERPTENDCRCANFVFLHSDLIAAGLNLSRGVSVSCMIFCRY